MAHLRQGKWKIVTFDAPFDESQYQLFDVEADPGETRNLTFQFPELNNRDKNFTKAKVKRRLRQIDESIARYLSEMESLDRRHDEQSSDRTQRLSEKIRAVADRGYFKGEELKVCEDHQIVG